MHTEIKLASRLVETARREAREEASSELTARWLALRQKEESTRGRDRERVIALAVVLAERLLGASLTLDPSHIAALARAVLDETRGARRALVEAHPLENVAETQIEESYGKEDSAARSQRH